MIDHRCSCGRFSILHDSAKDHRVLTLDAPPEVLKTFTNGGPTGLGSDVGNLVTTLIAPGELVESFGRRALGLTCNCDGCWTLYDSLIGSGEYERLAVRV